jgi:cytochrome c oxidase subunit 2
VDGARAVGWLYDPDLSLGEHAAIEIDNVGRFEFMPDVERQDVVAAGVSLHLLTRYTIPWKEVDIRSAQITPDQTFNIQMADHQFKFPSEKLVIKRGQFVRFDVRSADLTYGFGLFRPNNSMLFQMQVVPGHANQIVWRFDEPGTFTVRSTEYSGPEGIDMIKKDAVVVTQ